MPPASAILDDEARVCKAFNAFLVDFHQKINAEAEPTIRPSSGKRNRKAGQSPEQSPFNRSGSDMQAKRDQKIVLNRVDVSLNGHPYSFPFSEVMIQEYHFHRRARRVSPYLVDQYHKRQSYEDLRLATPLPIGREINLLSLFL